MISAIIDIQKNSCTLEYRINGGGVRIIGGLEMVRYNNTGCPKKSSGVWLNAEKKVLNLAISNQSSEMLDIST